jgi:hypothetical protein
MRSGTEDSESGEGEARRGLPGTMMVVAHVLKNSLHLYVFDRTPIEILTSDDVSITCTTMRACLKRVHRRECYVSSEATIRA